MGKDNVDEIEFSDDNKRRIIFGFGVVAIFIFLYFVFVVGASYGCGSGGGSLLKGVDGMRCVDLDSVDLCREKGGRIVNKPYIDFNFTVVNNTVGWGD